MSLARAALSSMLIPVALRISEANFTGEAVEMISCLDCSERANAGLRSLPPSGVGSASRLFALHLRTLMKGTEC